MAAKALRIQKITRTFFGDLGVEEGESGIDGVDTQALTLDCIFLNFFLLTSIKVLGSGGKALIGLVLRSSFSVDPLSSLFFFEIFRRWRKLFLW